MDPSQLCPGKDLVLPTLNVDWMLRNTRFLLLLLPNNEMLNKSSFVVHKDLIGIGGEPKSIKWLRSGDLFIETNSVIPSESFLLVKTFLNSSVNLTLHKSLNSCIGVISERDLMSIPESEIPESFSDHGVIQEAARAGGLSKSEDDFINEVLDDAVSVMNLTEEERQERILRKKEQINGTT
ncbi:putative RNA-directed DNA polymerase from transposon BS [Trichonephila clavipes]|nr:putative RNA-directed DNA polymerase from transposon BS [Trichonephila clavipes]